MTPLANPLIATNRLLALAATVAALIFSPLALATEQSTAKSAPHLALQSAAASSDINGDSDAPSEMGASGIGPSSSDSPSCWWLIAAGAAAIAWVGLRSHRQARDPGAPKGLK